MRSAPKSLTLVAVIVAACGQADPPWSDDTTASVRRPTRDVIARAHDAAASLARASVPRDLDALVQDLSLAGRDAANPRAIDALRAAGDLVAARWRLRRDARDLARALDYYRAAAQNPARPGACAALRSRAALLTEATSPLAAEGHAAVERFCATAANARSTSIATATSNVRRVVIDPGHGGSDPGALGPTGLTEAAVNLDVARRVAERLATRYGVQVVLTRDNDTYIDLESRAVRANEAGADLFVSIHCNAAPNRDAHGIATFVLDTMSGHVHSRVSRREGELVVADPMGTWDVANILTSMRLSTQGRRSLALAEGIQGAMLHDLRLFYPAVDDVGVHPAAFQVLVAARMPAVLIELSFISNPMEEQRLRTENYRDVLAGAIARAIASYGM